MKFRLRRDSDKGFTLVEMAIYVVLASLMFLLIMQIAFSISDSHERTRTYLDMNSTVMAAFSKFSRDIKRATSVDEIASTLGGSSGKLVLKMKRDDGTDDVTTIYLSDDKVKVEENGEYLGDLTKSTMNISNLTFRLFEVSTTTAVRVEMTVGPKASSTVEAINFYGTYVLRGSYVE